MFFSGQKIQVGLVLAVAVALFAGHTSLYWQWAEDDAFITFRYAENLVAGQGLVFNPGQKVEGYSNFAWVLTSAGATALGLDPLLAARVLAMLAGALCLPVAWLLARRMMDPASPACALFAPLAVAVAPVLTRHATSGLETDLFALLLLLGVYLSGRRAAGGGRVALLVVLLLLAVTRPEGPVLAVVILLLRFFPSLSRGDLAGAAGRRRSWQDLAVFLVVFGAYYAWRWSYFGEPVTNTYHMKMTGQLTGIVDGIQYAADFLREGGGLLLLGLALVPLLGVKLQPAYLRALVILACYFAFIVVAGGDWMFHFRFFAHCLPVLAAAAAAGLGSLFTLAGPDQGLRRRLRWVCAVLFLATTLATANAELKVSREIMPAVASKTYLADKYAALGRWFRQNSSPEAVVAISDVGAVGFYSGRTILDMFGLLTPHIARQPGKLHHKADPRYVLAQRPDYVVLVQNNRQGTGDFLRVPDSKLNRLPEFHDSYSLLWQDEGMIDAETLLVFQRRE